MKSIFTVLETINDPNSNAIISKTKNFFWIFRWTFEIYI